MIFIRKKKPLPELLELKQEAEKKGLNDEEGYDLLGNPLKSQVRNNLMIEQGHLCAYCMRRIPDNRILETDKDFSSVYIEHWAARSALSSTLENKGLDYNNLLAVCSGNEKVTGAIGKHKRRFLTCDKKKENKQLTVNPLDEDTLKGIFYESDGSIRSKDSKIDQDLVNTLNLNCKTDGVELPQCRKEVLEAIQYSVYNQGDDLLENCIQQLHIWESETDPKTPYIGIGIWWLKQQIKDMQPGK